MKKGLSILIALLLSAAMLLSACGKKTDEGNLPGKTNSASQDDTFKTNDNSKEDNTFKVGLEAGYPPFNWTQLDDSNGAVKIQNAAEYAGGYDVEIAKIIAQELGKELVIVKTEWDGLIPALTSGKIDAIIAGMSPTE